jgi:hypothetical protein
MTPRNLSMYVTTTMSYALRPTVTRTRHVQAVAVGSIPYVAQLSEI